MVVPILVPMNTSFTAVHTFFSVHGKEYAFSIHDVPPPCQSGKTSLAKAKLECDTQTRNLLMGFEPLLQQRLNQSYDLRTFVMELKDILESIVNVELESSLPPAGFYEHVWLEICAIGWENIAWLGADLTSLHLRIFDEAGREHIVEVVLPPNYPIEEPITSADLPSKVDLRWQEGFTLQNLIEQYKKVIEAYQDLWYVLEDLDKKVWVMEPEHPSRANIFRRVAIGGHCSLSLTVNPLAPRLIPEFRFFGSDVNIVPLKKKMNKNMKRWKVDRLLLSNLEDVLEMTFPSVKDTLLEDMSADCGICYAFRLSDGDVDGENSKKDGCVPDRACDNGNCGRPFHTSCLVEWLRSISTTRQSFDVIFGNCPYCSYPIAVKVLPSS